MKTPAENTEYNIKGDAILDQLKITHKLILAQDESFCFQIIE